MGWGREHESERIMAKTHVSALGMAKTHVSDGQSRRFLAFRPDIDQNARKL